MSSLTVDTLTNQNSQLCKAWVNLNGTTTSIRDSYNISSITDVSTGRFILNFTNHLDDSNYSLTTFASRLNSEGVPRMVIHVSDSHIRTASQLELLTENTSGTTDEPEIVCVNVFGN